MRVLVCGSRSWKDGSAIHDRLAQLPHRTEFIFGGAVGADELARTWAIRNGRGYMLLLDDWKTQGKRAGIVRNLRMLDEQPGLVVAFWDGKSRGTKHTIGEARKRGIPVEVVS